MLNTHIIVRNKRMHINAVFNMYAQYCNREYKFQNIPEIFPNQLRRIVFTSARMILHLADGCTRSNLDLYSSRFIYNIYIYIYVNI